VVGFFFQAEDGIRDFHVTGVQTCALPIFRTSSDCSAAVDGCSWLAPLQGAPELARPPRATLVIRQGRHRGRRGGNPRKLIEIKRSEERRVGKEGKRGRVSSR